MLQGLCLGKSSGNVPCWAPSLCFPVVACGFIVAIRIIICHLRTVWRHVFSAMCSMFSEQRRCQWMGLCAIDAGHLLLLAQYGRLQLKAAAVLSVNMAHKRWTATISVDMSCLGTATLRLPLPLSPLQCPFIGMFGLARPFNEPLNCQLAIGRGRVSRASGTRQLPS